MNLRLGGWSRLLAPGYGWCLRCRTPWRFVRGHVTPYQGVVESPVPGLPPAFSCGCFPLCEHCWADLADPEARLPFYRQLWESWVRAATPSDTAYLAELDRDWPAIRDAVLAGR